jgi:acetyl esterase/lipase
MGIFALALAFIALALSIWIVVPGPILPLFILSVGGTELWPALALLDAATLAFALRAHGRGRPLSVALSAAALLATFAPPVAYLVRGPYIPFSAFFAPMHLNTATLKPGAPVVLAIYGGAWERGSPQNDAVLNATIESWGYRVVALDYPHSPRFHWPAQRDAILRQIDALHAPRIAILGHSSGAQLAMIAAALRPRKIDAVITYESPVDLRLGYEYPSKPDVINARKIMDDLCNGTPPQRPACYRSSSPRYVVHPGMPPVLMIAGGRDHVVNLGFERLFRDELRHDGVSVDYIELPWADHAFETVPYGFHDRIALWYVRRFLDARFKPSSSLPRS